MKKIISVILVVTTVLSIGAFSASALSWNGYNSYGTPISESDNGVSKTRDIVYGYLLENTSLNKAAICGILGNIWAECCFRVTESYGSYHGLCQWGYGRWENCQNYCLNNGYDVNSVEGQAGFLIKELRGPYKGTYNKLLNVPDSEDGVYQAEDIFRVNFEGCGTQAKQRRQAAAINYWRNLPNTAAMPVSTSKPTTTKATTTTTKPVTAKSTTQAQTQAEVVVEEEAPTKKVGSVETKTTTTVVQDNTPKINIFKTIENKFNSFRIRVKAGFENIKEKVEAFFTK